MSTRATLRHLATPVGLFSVAAILLTSLTSAGSQAGRGFDPLRDSLSSNQPQPIYSSETSDPWNRLFQLLFTRTLDVRLTAGEPTLFLAGDDRLMLAKGTVRRVESGDRAIDPLYPSWVWMGSTLFDMSVSGSWEILREPHYSQLVEALRDVRRSASQRAPLARALMQADLWAAFDIFFASSAIRGHSAGAVERQRRIRDVLPLLGATIRTLALDRAEISTLLNTYSEGVRGAGLPDLFGARSEWFEVRLSPERMHDHAADYRRAARVFVKPTGADTAAFVRGLQEGGAPRPSQVEAVALVIQALLISDDGVPLPSPITFEVQIRKIPSHHADVPLQYELSRRLLLSSAAKGGMVQLRGDAPAYLAMAGNDFSFATRPRQGEDPVLVPLRRRCQSCHGPDLNHVISFSFVPPHPEGRERLVGILTPAENEHVRFVARRKAAREDFRALRDYWRQ